MIVLAEKGDQNLKKNTKKHQNGLFRQEYAYRQSMTSLPKFLVVNKI